MIKSFKVMLLPNNKQLTKLFQYAGTSRFAYNWAIAKQQDNYKQGCKFLSDNILRKEFTKLKQQKEFEWLNDISCNVPKQAIKDACDSYVKFFKGLSKFPKFKSKRKSKPSFYQDSFKIKFTGTHVKVECFSNSKRKNRLVLNQIKLAERNRIPINSKYSNPRFTFDGLNWWVSVGVEVDDVIFETPTNDSIGIDLGVKDLAICSNDVKYKNINKTSKVKKIKKKQRRLQRKISRQYLKNKKGVRFCKTCNIIKSERKLLKLNHKLSNIRHNYIHQTTSDIIKRKPSMITMEDLNIQGMMRNRHLSKAIQEQCLYEFKRQVEYKSKWNNIDFKQVPRFYASSKTCSSCGNIKKDLKLSDRTYRCDCCGLVIDRDFNASLNVDNYYKLVI